MGGFYAHMTRACAVFCLAALAVQTPQFRSGVDIVRFEVVVVDADRHPIAGLTVADFRVTEGGTPLRIAGFEAVTIPAGPATTAGASAAADLSVETVTNQRRVPGRIVVIVMDWSIASEQPLVSARRVANAAIDALGPNDLAAVVFTSGVAGNRLQGLTANRDRLRAAVASAQTGKTLDVNMTPKGASNVTVTASLRVRYAADAKSGLLLPVEMSERYEARDPRGNLLDVITGEAKYSNPRRFDVSAEAK